MSSTVANSECCSLFLCSYFRGMWAVTNGAPDWNGITQKHPRTETTEQVASDSQHDTF